MDNHKLGKEGENIASVHLVRKGYRILETNYRCKSGEIDIIAQLHDTLVFIEVKTRTSTLYGYPCEAVNSRKINRYKRIANTYLMNKKYDNLDCRFDVIELLKKDNKFYINHIKNAFT